MKRIILLAAVALVMLCCGEKQNVRAVIVGKTADLTSNYSYYKLYLNVIGTDSIIVRETGTIDGAILEIGDTIITTIRVK